MGLITSSHSRGKHKDRCVPLVKSQAEKGKPFVMVTLKVTLALHPENCFKKYDDGIDFSRKS